ncbi:M20/M25/M40 family metallo-hydrolase [Ornithinibacillus sp. 4-3]|uniref:M20/M25/M40 family metallo-hydrolase n=1 Tax=Ornithinibacillus sp. 4-3 TaxID=3231488 RepID=A0AB39HIT1_9BACI
MINKERLINYFIDFVQTSSETKQEKYFANKLKHHMSELGCEVIEDDSTNITKLETGNVICRLPGTKSNIPSLLFCAHMDTVTPGTAIHPIICNSEIKSDGTTILGADDKAAIAALVEVIHILQEEKIEFGNIELLFTVGEESGFLGSKALQSKDLQSNFGYVLDSEGSVGSIEVASAAQCAIKLLFDSSDSHFSMIDIYKEIRNLYNQVCADSSSDLSMVQFGTVENTKKNEIKLLLTTFDQDEIRLFHLQLQDYIKNKLSICHPQLIFELVNPSHIMKKNDQLISLFKQATKQQKIPYKSIVNRSGSDTNILASYGLDVANIAVGYKNIHTKQESISIDDLFQLTKLILQIIQCHANEDN